MVCCLTIVRTTSHKKLLQSANRKGIKKILHTTFTTRNVDFEKEKSREPDTLDINGEFSPSYPQNTFSGHIRFMALQYSMAHYINTVSLLHHKYYGTLLD